MALRLLRPIAMERAPAGRWRLVLLAGLAVTGILMSAAWPQFHPHPSWAELWVALAP